MTDDVLKTRLMHRRRAASTDTETTHNDLQHFKCRLERALQIATDPDVTEGPWRRTPYASNRLCTKDDMQVLVCSVTRDNRDFEAADRANGLFVMLSRAMLVQLLRSTSELVKNLENELWPLTADGQPTGSYCELPAYRQLRALWLELKDHLPS